jgi:DNA ligase (NAD+)
MGLPQVGASTAKDLARQCGSLAGLAEYGPQAVVILAEPRYQRLIAELIAVGFAPAHSGRQSANADTPLQGKTFVLTGALPNLTRAEATAKIEAAGGKAASTVSAATHFVVVGAEPGAKLAQARALGVAVLDEAALLKMIDGK